jgi:methionyl-tRNA formyltransferase
MSIRTTFSIRYASFSLDISETLAVHMPDLLPRWLEAVEGGRVAKKKKKTANTSYFLRTVRVCFGVTIAVT